MAMESGADAQQGAETAVSENENQQLTQAQIATLGQVLQTVRQMNSGHHHFKILKHEELKHSVKILTLETEHLSLTLCVLLDR